MKDYSILLFDMDDTLLSFSKAEEKAFEILLEKYDLPKTQDFLDRYHQINDYYWTLLEKGEMTLDYLGVKRFQDVFEEYQLERDANKVNQDFFELLSYQAIPVDNAYEILEYFQDKDIYIVTNGKTFIQERRFNSCKLKELTKGIFISDSMKYKKPSSEYFQTVHDSIKGNKEDMLLIGDSPTSDLMGGVNYHIDTCWFNPNHKETTVPHTYEIDNLIQLKDIIKK